MTIARRLDEKSIDELAESYGVCTTRFNHGCEGVCGGGGGGGEKIGSKDHRFVSHDAFRMMKSVIAMDGFFYPTLKQMIVSLSC